jgi:hypothetical protein
MKRTRVVLLLAALCFVLGVNGFAADNAYLYLVHGIPGRDIADNINPGYPVDVLIDGECVVRGLTYDNTSGPLSFAPGTYSVQISESNSLAACTNATVIDSTVTLSAGASVSAVAALSGGQPALLTFTDNLTPVTPGNARFVFANSADAPALQVTLTQLFVKNPQTFTATAKPNAQAVITVPYGTYSVTVAAAGSTTVLASEQETLPNQSATFTYAAGQAANNSVGLVNRTVRDVF